MTLAAVVAAWERWILARTALTAGSRSQPAPPEVADEAKAAFAAYWDAAGIYEREQAAAGHADVIGFRSRFPGWWADAAGEGVPVTIDAWPPVHDLRKLTKAERAERMRRRYPKASGT